MPTNLQISMVHATATDEYYRPPAGAASVLSSVESRLVQVGTLQQATQGRTWSLVPGTLPTGFAFETAHVSSHSLYLIYSRANPEPSARLVIREYKIDHSMLEVPVQRIVAPDSYSSVTVNGRPGYVVRGGWTDTPEPDGRRRRRWVRELQTSLIYVSGDDMVTNVAIRPNSGLAESELASIAGSLRPNSG